MNTRESLVNLVTERVKAVDSRLKELAVARAMVALKVDELDTAKRELSKTRATLVQSVRDVLIIAPGGYAVDFSDVDKALAL
jgi:hypothetical protein